MVLRLEKCVIPSLSTLDSHTALAGGGTVIAVPPPARFRPILGSPTAVRINPVGRYTPSQGVSSAQKNGLRYEAKAQSYLIRELGHQYLPSPFIHFCDDSGFRTCIPDGILHTPNSTFVFEIKSQHMPEAWWQLKQLYAPVLRAYNPEIPVHCIEVVRSYDPAMPFPCPVTVIDDLAAWIKNPSIGFGVLICRL